MEELAGVAVRLLKKEQEKAALAKAEADDRQWRERTGIAALKMFSESVNRLATKIESFASNSVVLRSPGEVKIEFGFATLIFKLHEARVERGSFKLSGWDVIYQSEINFFQSLPSFLWSVSLWYAKLPSEAGFRWYEASYYTQNGFERAPRFAKSIKEADMAAKLLGSVGIAFGPVPIDDEYENDFHHRWIWLLTQAAEGKLGRPSRFPIEWPPDMIPGDINLPDDAPF